MTARRSRRRRRWSIDGAEVYELPVRGVTAAECLRDLLRSDGWLECGFWTPADYGKTLRIRVWIGDDVAECDWVVPGEVRS